MATDRSFSTLERRLLDSYQRGFPLVERPFAAIADELGCSEETVIDSYRGLAADGAITRIGLALEPNRAGASTLAAMSVPADRLDAVAAQVSAHPEVTHNYEREHAINLWFVVAAAGREGVDAVLAGIAGETGLEVRDLRLEEPFKLDLGFPLEWD
jgi:DNA-binding Lrp family transcriptional regulator